MERPKGGYRRPFDPRPLLRRLEYGTDIKATWHELWGEFHRQGQVGDASYASVPRLVRIHRQRGVPDWNPYALVVCIEVYRGQGNNPEMPGWLREDYFDSIQELSKIGVAKFAQARAPAEVRGTLTILALSKGARFYAKLILEYSEEELIDLEVLDLHS